MSKSEMRRHEIMGKPREWWIQDPPDKHDMRGYVSKDCNVSFEKRTYSVHVIEYSAYEQVVRERDEARALHDDAVKEHDECCARSDKLIEALRWISGIDENKPYTTYYERTLDDGTVVPTCSEIAGQAIAEYERETIKI